MAPKTSSTARNPNTQAAKTGRTIDRPSASSICTVNVAYPRSNALERVAHLVVLQVRLTETAPTRSRTNGARRISPLPCPVPRCTKPQVDGCQRVIDVPRRLFPRRSPPNEAVRQWVKELPYSHEDDSKGRKADYQEHEHERRRITCRKLIVQSPVEDWRRKGACHKSCVPHVKPFGMLLHGFHARQMRHFLSMVGQLQNNLKDRSVCPQVADSGGQRRPLPHVAKGRSQVQCRTPRLRGPLRLSLRRFGFLSRARSAPRACASDSRAGQASTGAAGLLRCSRRANAIGGGPARATCGGT